jgi:hypothetical protein
MLFGKLRVCLCVEEHDFIFCLQAGWESECLRKSALSVYCSSFRISEGPLFYSVRTEIPANDCILFFFDDHYCKQPLIHMILPFFVAGCPDNAQVQGILPCQYDSTKVDEKSNFFPIGDSSMFRFHTIVAFCIVPTIHTLKTSIQHRHTHIWNGI